MVQHFTPIADPLNACVTVPTEDGRSEYQRWLVVGWTFDEDDGRITPVVCWNGIRTIDDALRVTGLTSYTLERAS